MLAHSLSFAGLTCDILLFSVIAQAAPLQPLASSVLVSISIFASLNSDMRATRGQDQLMR